MYAGTAGEPEDLDLRALLLAHLVVAVGLAQVGASLVGAGAVGQRQPGDVHEKRGGAVNLHLGEADLDRWDDAGAGLGGHGLLQGRDLGQAGGCETAGLVQPQDDRPALGHIAEGAQRGPQCGDASGSTLDLHLGEVVVPASQSGNERGC